MSFRSVDVLWLAALVPLALWFLLARESTRRALGRRFAAERLRGVATPGRALRPWILTLAAGAGVVALAGPYSGYEVVPLTSREVNRVLAIDVSNSMGATDVGSARLVAARAIAMRLVRAQQGKVAVIAFEGTAEVIAPFTDDTDAVAALVETLQPGELGQPGSDMGGAVMAALQLAGNDPAQQADIVVVSDGEDQGGRLAEAARRAAERGVRVSAVMIGTAAGSTIPTARGPMRDDSGATVTTYARSEPLARLTTATGGRLLENPFAEDALAPLLSGGEAGAPRRTHARVPVDRYQWPLALVFAALLGASVLNRGAE